MLPLVVAGGIVALVERCFGGSPPPEVASAAESAESSKPEVDSVDYVIGVLAAEKNKLANTERTESPQLAESEAYDLAINKLIQYRDQIDDESENKDA